MDSTYFSPRQKKILKFLANKSKWTKGAEIAAEFGISDRTVRNDISVINSYFKDENPVITSISTKGYCVENREKAINLLKDNMNFMPISPEDRVNYILKELLFEKSGANIYQLSEDILVSEATVENDLKKIKDIIKGSGRKLEIERKGINIYLLGSEKDKRLLLSELLFKEANGNFLNLSKYQKYFTDFDLYEIKSSLFDIIKKHNFQINEMAVVSLIIHVAITMSRIKNKNTVDLNSNTSSISNSIEYKMSKEFCYELEKNFDIQFSEQEIFYISYLFLGKKIIKNIYKHRNEIENIIDPFYIELIDKLLKAICYEYGIDFKNDDTLFIGLTLHIKTMHERIKNNICLRNLILGDFKRRYPLIFEIAVFTCNEFYRLTNERVDENEIGFIALHLGAAYERLGNNLTGLTRVALVCPTGYTTSNLLCSKIASLYSDKIEIIGIFSFFSLYSLTHVRPDFIFTTVDFEHDLNIPTIVISPFLDEKDIKSINENLNLYHNKNTIKKVKADIENYFKSELFYNNVYFDNKMKAIKFMAEDLYKKLYVPGNYEDLVVEREKLSSTSFANLVAIPHPIEMNAYKTAISVAILEKPMHWGEQKVQLILMFSIKAGERKNLNNLYNHLINIIDEQQGVNYLIKSRDFNDFTYRIISYFNT